MGAPAVTVGPATNAAEVALARTLAREYAAALDFDLAYQGFEAEMAALPGKYAPPTGALLLGRLDGRVVGMVALQDLGGGIAEMKRLYVRPEARGSGLGLALARAVIAEARGLGYRAMRLDTVPGQHDRAIRLYESLGFRPIAAYYASPIAGTRYYQLDLA